MVNGTKRIDYTYDNNGNITAITYTYDMGGNLTIARRRRNCSSQTLAVWLREKMIQVAFSASRSEFACRKRSCWSRSEQ